MKWVLIVGQARSGTSYLAERIHAAGIPMWLEPPGTVHNECPAMIAAVDGLQDGSTDGLHAWRERAAAAGRLPIGAKEPRLCHYPRETHEAFPPADSLYIVCRRKRADAMTSLRHLTKWDDAACAAMLDCDGAAWDTPSTFWFDYDGDIDDQERNLSAALGVTVDLSTKWSPGIWTPR